MFSVFILVFYVGNLIVRNLLLITVLTLRSTIITAF